jgi:plasmid stability protein
MASLHLKNVPEHVHIRLRARARRNRRSINSEILVLLEEALTSTHPDTVDVEEAIQLYAACRSRMSGQLNVDELKALREQGRS